MWWEGEGRNGNGYALSSDEHIDQDSTEKVEEELLMLGQLGLDHDDTETRQTKRRDDRRRYVHTSSRLTLIPTPPTSTPPPIPAPKSIGPEAAPLWRITAAVDPNTTPLELMTVWAVEIDPRKSSNFMQFSRSISRRLRAAEGGGDGQEHIRREEEQRRQDEDDDEDLEEDLEEDDSEDEDDSMKHLRLFHRMNSGPGLSALVCRVQDVPSMEKVMALLKSADVVHDGTNPRPYQVQVPKFPAPSRDRLPEWKSFWPVAVKHGKAADFQTRTSISNNSNINQNNLTPGAVDRAADARLWTKEATQWAIANFRKCLDLAKKAKEQGELPIGVHVTPSFSDLETSSTTGPDGHSWIEVDAWDTRRSERNPIKHGVTNAIRDVAKLRSDRDREKLIILGAKVAATLNREPEALPQAIRQATAAKSTNDAIEGPATSARAVANSGQDYLLNNLILFTTHEPCLLCCMSLVHSRVRAVYFIQPSPGAGGCCGSGLEEELRCTFAQDGGPYAIQEQAGLNHHFDVWKWVGDRNDLSQDNLDQLLDIYNLDA